VLRLVGSEPHEGDVSAEARAFADDLEDGQLGHVRSAIVITQGSQLATHYWGTGLNLIDAIGVLEAAKAYQAKLIRKCVSNANWELRNASFDAITTSRGGGPYGTDHRNRADSLGQRTPLFAP
jgi:hypothetical protein